MEQIGWRFPPLSGGTRQGYTNNDIEVFKGQDLIDNLAREICQNSLDAHSEDMSIPVRVVFELKSYRKNDFDVFSQYSSCLQGCRNYWKENMDAKLERFVKSAEATLQEERIPVLVASDYNTKGLGGCKSLEIKTPWEALTGSDGVHVNNDATSGGSFGIGKNAPFACSSLSMVFYNTLNSAGENAFIGVARLATILDEQNEPTQRVGKYQVNDNENKKWYPIYSENACSFRDCFLREETGTDVIIVGFSQSSGWMVNVANAVLKNFFVAVLENRLVVELIEGDHRVVIDPKTIEQLFDDCTENVDMVQAFQLYKSFTCPTVKQFYEIFEPNDLEIYVRSDASYKRTIANFRSTGMLVGTYFKRIFQHYAAVVVVRGKMLGELLRDTEPPRHNRWDYKQIELTEKEKRNKAKKAIEQIEAIVSELLKTQFEEDSEKVVDAAGVGEYIPDDVDGMNSETEGDDILKVNIKLGKTRTRKNDLGSKSQVAVQDEGSEESGEVHNHVRHPHPLPPNPPVPVPVVPGPDDPEQKQGATPGKGLKTIIAPNLSAQRAFPVSSSQGLYKIVIIPKESYSNMFVECFAVGEDGRSDPLEILSFTYSGKNIMVKDGKAGPIAVPADIPAVFFARFSNKEKLKLGLHLTEVNKK